MAKLDSLISDLSFEEKSILGSSIATLAIAVYYFAHALGPSPGSAGEVAGLAIGAVVLLVIIEIVYHILLAIACRRDPPDERDRGVAARATRNAYLVLCVTGPLVIAHVAAGALLGVTSSRWLAPFMTAHLMLLGLVVSELVKYASRLWYYRRGF
jgi:hypothetical protein